MRIFLPIFFFFKVGVSFCQKNDTVVLTATIKNEQFEVLSHSSVGIKHNSKINTVADINGYFKIRCLKSDTLIVRHVGYKKAEYPINALISNDTFNIFKIIILPETYKQLNEVVVTAKKGKIKYKNYGSNSTDRALALGVTSNSLGYEIGVKINIPERKETKIEKFNCYISNSSADSIKFRLNIYSFANKDSSINLVNNNIILVSNIKRGHLSFDLSQENIYLKDDILITLEVIEYFGKGSVDFSTSTIKGGTYFRTGKESPWEKFPIVGLAFNIDVKLF